MLSFKQFILEIVVYRHKRPDGTEEKITQGKRLAPRIPVNVHASRAKAGKKLKVKKPRIRTPKPYK